MRSRPTLVAQDRAGRAVRNWSQQTVLTVRDGSVYTPPVETTPILRSRQEQLIEHRFAEPMDALLRRLYVDEALTQPEIAVRLGASTKSVSRWMVKYRIPARDLRALAPEAATA